MTHRLERIISAHMGTLNQARLLQYTQQLSDDVGTHLLGTALAQRILPVCEELQPAAPADAGLATYIYVSLQVHASGFVSVNFITTQSVGHASRAEGVHEPMQVHSQAPSHVASRQLAAGSKLPGGSSSTMMPAADCQGQQQQQQSAAGSDMDCCETAVIRDVCRALVAAVSEGLDVVETAPDSAADIEPAPADQPATLDAMQQESDDQPAASGACLMSGP